MAVNVVHDASRSWHSSQSIPCFYIRQPAAIPHRSMNQVRTLSLACQFFVEDNGHKRHKPLKKYDPTKHNENQFQRPLIQVLPLMEPTHRAEATLLFVLLC
jgi:hypothetical protein